MSEQSYNRVKAVVFDVGGVLCRGGLGRRMEIISRDYGIDIADLREFARKYRSLTDLGVWSEVRYWREMHASFDIEMDPAMESLEPLSELRTDTLELAGRLQSVGLQVAVLTNDSKELAWSRREKIGEIIREPSPYIISSEEEISKPSPELYRTVCNRIGFPPGQIVMIDDARHNILGAEHAGMQGIVFTDAAALEEELKRRGVEL